MKKTYIIPQVEDVQLDELMQTFGVAQTSAGDPMTISTGESD